jgi:excisionase family DNA binding protein
VEVKRNTAFEDLPLLLRTEDVAAFLGEGIRNVRKWLREARIPSVKMGKRLWVRRQDLLAAFDPDQKKRRVSGRGGVVRARGRIVAVREGAPGEA